MATHKKDCTCIYCKAIKEVVQQLKESVTSNKNKNEIVEIKVKESKNYIPKPDNYIGDPKCKRCNGEGYLPLPNKEYSGWYKCTKCIGKFINKGES